MIEYMHNRCIGVGRKIFYLLQGKWQYVHPLSPTSREFDYPLVYFIYIYFYIRFILKLHEYFLLCIDLTQQLCRSYLFDICIDFAQQTCRSYLLNILPKRHTKGLSQGKEKQYKGEIWVSSIFDFSSRNLQENYPA